MKKTTFIRLIDSYLQGSATLEERNIVEAYYQKMAEKGKTDLNAGREAALQQQMLLNILTGIEGERKPSVRLWPRIVAIAAAVAMIVFGVWFYNSSRDQDASLKTAIAAVQDIAPGKNGATLTLANGQVIQLSDEKKGVVVGNGKLAYNDGSSLNGGSALSPSGRDAEGRAGNNNGSNNPLSPQGGSLPEGERGMMLIASTAKGQTYQVELPDGTKVWLNADSKISFPSKFNGKERKILLEGEAYFEVAHNAKQLFRVETALQEVTVLGTHFNINSYADEGATKTTLLEGSVRVNDAITLRPNQQAILSGTKRIVVKDVDAGEAVLWKEGKFSFSSEELSSIMRKVARWYNIEVVYDPGVDQQTTFSGSVSRFDNVSNVLRMLRKTSDLHFKIEGRKVLVGK